VSRHSLSCPVPSDPVESANRRWQKLLTSPAPLSFQAFRKLNQKRPSSKQKRSKKMLFGKKQSVAGLDIGSSSIKMVELDGKANNLNLVSLGFENLPDDSII